MLADYHLHSDYSGDCNVPMQEMIEGAIAKKVDRLCFTEHHDLDFPDIGIDFTLDIDRYYEELMKYKAIYSNQIQILFGIELGIQGHLYPQLSQIASSYPFDFILASNHLAKGADPFDPSYFQTRSQYQGYFDYFEDMLNNVTHYSDFDVFSHLDYVIRYGNFKDKKIYYPDFIDLLDAILKTIIAKGKGIEINTSGIRYGLGQPHPSYEILARYKELGGEIITLGSDAHTAKDITRHFDQAKELLKKAGFSYFTTFVKRKPYFHHL
jgi:histidinol-phosphatase (PHP family)